MSVQSLGDERSQPCDDRSIEPPWVAVLALTGAMWSAQFAMRFANALFDLPMAALAPAGAGGAVSALVGAGLCLALTPILKRVRPDGLTMALALLLVLTSAAAAVWRVVDAGVLKVMLEVAPYALGIENRRSEAGAASWWLFFGWAGMWLAAAHAERLRLASERLLELEGVASARSEDDDVVWPGNRRGAVRTRVSGIVMLEAERDYVRVHLRDGRTLLVRATLTGLVDQLGPDRFVRIHRSAAVNRDALTETRTRDGDLILLLNTGRDVRVGRRRRASVLEALGAPIRRPPAA